MKNIHFDAEAMALIKAGVDKLANVVKTTLGPGGSNVILERNGRTHVTKDGVTIAREIDLPDSVENIGANIVKEAASKTAELAGDGTTTATVLAQAILTQGIRHLASGANRMDIKRGIDIAVQDCVTLIKQMATEIKEGDIEKIASISSNYDPEITKLITDAINAVGREGIIIVEDSGNSDSSLALAEGSQFDRGWLSQYFVTNEAKMECVLENPYILIFDGVITSFKNELLAPLQALQVVKQSNVPVLVIAHDVQGEALHTMTANKIKNGIALCAVQAPDYGETRTQVLLDIAALTGGKLINKAEGLTLANMLPEHFGTCQKVRISQFSTTIIGADGGNLLSRINSIKNQMEGANENAIVKLNDRIARLTSKMGILYVGGTTDVEIREKKDRIDDALQATRSALDEGVVVGGAIAYVRVKEKLDTDEYYRKRPKNKDQADGYQIVMDSLAVPFRTIVDNVGLSGEVAYGKVVDQYQMEQNYGFNAKTMQYGNLMTQGIIDPAKVVRLALENAASVSGMLLTTKAVVSVIPQNQPL